MLHLRHGLLEISDDVIDMFNAHGEADEVGSHACLYELLIAELAMCVAGGM